MTGRDASEHDATGRSQQGDPAAPDGPSFADVLNSLVAAGGSRRESWWARRRATPAPGIPDAGPAEPAEAEPADEAVVTEPEPSEEPAAVRPYARTGGRTQPCHDLPVEALVATTDLGREPAAASVEHVPIARLCEQSRSVAEVSALLAVPLGVARVLIADMVDAGLVEVHRTPTDQDGYPDRPLLERVLDGLRKL